MCVGDCRFQVFRSNDSDEWEVHNWSTTSNDYTRTVESQPDKRWKIQNLKVN